MQGLCAQSDNSMGTVTKRKVEAAIYEAWNIVRNSDMIPKDTGNLRYNSFKIERTGVNSWRIFIDHAIAPYDIYVNGEWISPKWNGKQNPNEGFWREVCDFIVNYLQQKLGGTVEAE